MKRVRLHVAINARPGGRAAGALLLAFGWVLAACSSSSGGTAGSDAGGTGDGAPTDATTEAAPGDGATDAPAIGCSGARELPEGAWQFDNASGTLRVYESFADAGSPAGYAITGVDSMTDAGGGYFRVAIQFLSKPSPKTYSVQAKGVISDPNSAFIDVEIVNFLNVPQQDYPGLAGGCIDVTPDPIHPGGVIASFVGLMVANGDAGALPVSATMLGN
jgi:hypothetical protein